MVVRLRVDADESDVACCRVTVRTRGDSSILLGSAEVPQRREWLDVEVTLARPIIDREELEVRIGFRSPAPVEVQRIRLER